MSIVVGMNDSLDDIRLELGKLIADQTARVMEVARWQDVAISNIMDRLFELSSLVKKLQSTLGTSKGVDSSSHQMAPGIKLDFPRFSGSNSKGWLFQAEVYFAFHNIMDDSRI